MSPSGVALATLLHALVALALWWVSPLHAPIDPPDDETRSRSRWNSRTSPPPPRPAGAAATTCPGCPAAGPPRRTASPPQGWASGRPAEATWPRRRQPPRPPADEMKRAAARAGTTAAPGSRPGPRAALRSTIAAAEGRAAPPTTAPPRLAAAASATTAAARAAQTGAVSRPRSPSQPQPPPFAGNKADSTASASRGLIWPCPPHRYYPKLARRRRSSCPTRDFPKPAPPPPPPPPKPQPDAAAPRRRRHSSLRRRYTAPTPPSQPAAGFDGTPRPPPHGAHRDSAAAFREPGPAVRAPQRPALPGRRPPSQRPRAYLPPRPVQRGRRPAHAKFSQRRCPDRYHAERSRRNGHGRHAR